MLDLLACKPMEERSALKTYSGGPVNNFLKQVVVYVASQELAKISSLLPSNKQRSKVVHALVNAMGLMSPDFSNTRQIQLVNPGRATYKDLAIYHSRDYLDFVLNPENSTREVSGNSDEANDFGLEDDCSPFPGLHDYVPLVAGATLTAANALARHVSDIAICWDGGRHHARKSSAAGFCYVADCVLAIMALKRAPLVSMSLQGTPVPPRKPRIMYLDLDLHFSDAVSEAFCSKNSPSSPQILTFSVHHSAPGFFPVSTLSQLPSLSRTSFDPFTLALPLRQGASDSTFARIWKVVERVKDAFEPDYIILQCGLDSLSEDPCATFNWSLTSLGWCVDRVINHWKGRKLLLGGGGYHNANAARVWAYLTSIALNNALSPDTEIPDHVGFPLYAPSFILDVPAGNMQDLNSEEDLRSVEACFERIPDLIKEKISVIKCAR